MLLRRFADAKLRAGADTLFTRTAMQDSLDRNLGMHRPIRRRDFINGIALSAGAALSVQGLSGFETEHVAETSPDYYPPVLTGMRGSHEGAFETAHQMR